MQGRIVIQYCERSLVGELFQLFDDRFGTHADPIVVRDHSPGNFSFAVQNENRRASNVAALDTCADMSYAVRIDHFTIGIGQNLKRQICLIHNVLIFLGRVNTHSEHRSAEVLDF